MISIKTVQDLIVNFPDFFRDKKISLPYNHYINDIDVNDEKICKKFTLSDSNMLMKHGLLYEEGSIYFYYTKLNSIKIKPSKTIIEPLKESVKISCVGVIDIYKNGILEKTIEQIIYPIYSYDGDNFEQKNNIVNFYDNKSFFDHKCTITAKFGFSRKIFSDKLILTQQPNNLSQWIFNQEKINNIEVKYDKKIISNEGGTITLKVYKNVKKEYVKKDAFGDIFFTKNIENINEDITSDCIISVNDPHTVNGNKIYIKKQEINSEERIITAYISYLKHNKSINIIQEPGLKYTYKNILSFSNDSNEMTIVLETNNNKTEIIPIKNITEKYLKNEKIDEYLNESKMEISVIDDKWVSCNVIDNSLLEIIINKNINDFKRYNKIQIKSNNNIIYINIEQPTHKIVKTIYNVICNYKNSINNIYQLKFNVNRLDIYDDDIMYEHKILKNNHKLKVFLNEKEIPFSYKDENDTYIYYTTINEYDPNNIIYYVLDENDQIIDDKFTNQINAIKNIEVTVKVINHNNSDIISNNQPKITIKNCIGDVIVQDNLSHCWINSNMLVDNVYFKVIKLKENEKYVFNIEPYNFDNFSSDYITEEYYIENDDLGIDLNIDIY